MRRWNAKTTDSARASVLDVDGLEVHVTRKRQKNMYARVKPPDGRVVVTAPLHFSDDEIIWFIREKKDLILKHRERILTAGRAQQEAAGLSGKGGLSGDGAAEEAERSAQGGSGSGERHRASGANAPTQEELAEWRAIVEAFTPVLIEKWAPIIGVRPGKLAYRNMVSRWGSCNVKTGRICINVQLAAHPPECLEYVVVHELCHLREANHGPRFKALLDRYLPDWRQAEAKLKGGVRR